MSDVLTGVRNFLQLVNDNWTLIVIVSGMGIATFQKIKQYHKLSQDEKVELAMNAISQSILLWVSEAETNWQDYKKSGNIKRSEVIAKIFEQYPILSRVTNQKALMDTIDSFIDDALIDMKLIFKNKKGSDSNGNL